MQRNLRNDWNPGTKVLIWEYQHDRVWTVFKILVLRKKVTSALEGLKLFWCWDYLSNLQECKSSYEHHLNPIMLIFIGKLLLKTNRWVPCARGCHFSAFSHHFLTRLAISNKKVKSFPTAGHSFLLKPCCFVVVVDYYSLYRCLHIQRSLRLCVLPQM